MARWRGGRFTQRARTFPRLVLMFVPEDDNSQQAGYFHRVAKKPVEVPQLQQAIEQGELTVSQARRVERVATPENAGRAVA